jgi:transcriptional regulator of aromatic amino acid metabolism
MPGVTMPALDDKIVLYVVKKGSQPTDEDASSAVGAVFGSQADRLEELNAGFFIQKFQLEHLVSVAQSLPGTAGIQIDGADTLTKVMARDPWQAASVAALAHAGVALKDPAVAGPRIADAWEKRMRQGKGFFLQPLHRTGSILMLALCEQAPKKPWWRFWK